MSQKIIYVRSNFHLRFCIDQERKDPVLKNTNENRIFPNKFMKWCEIIFFFFAVEPQENEPEDIDRNKYEVKEIVSTNKFISKFDDVKLLYMYSTAT